MKALVVFESLWGNTERIARAIADGLSGPGTGTATGTATGTGVMTVDVAAAASAPNSVDGYDLLIVGGPTHAFSMSREATREAAVERDTAAHDPGLGIRDWLELLEAPTGTVSAATFDTRVDAPRLPGSAAKAAQKVLRDLDFTIAAKPESFRVHGYEGPLIDGEIERATAWGHEIAAALPAD